MSNMMVSILGQSGIGTGMSTDLTKMLEIEAIARQAGAAIMEVYNSADSLAVQYKDGPIRR